MTIELSGKIALVTGGSSGIGRATSLLFAREGAKVVVSDVNVQGGEETVGMIEKRGGDAVFVKTDVSKAAEVEALIDKAVKTYGRLDCAANNAGVGPQMTTLLRYSEEEWDRTMDINLKGVWLCLKYQIPRMLEGGGGAIVNISSAAGLVGVRGCSAYTASKHGVIGLTKTAALEFAHKGVRVNAVCPGNTETPMLEEIIDRGSENRELMLAMQPQKRMGAPEEIAEAVIWLCSDAASFVTGHAMAVDGGVVAQ